MNIVWSIRIFGNILAYIYLWYIKEYRFDRMLIHLKTRQGKRMLFPPWRRPPITPKSVLLFLVSTVCLYALFVRLPFNWIVNFLITDIATFPILSFWVLFTKFPTMVYHRVLIGRAVVKLRAHKPMMVIGITGSYGKTSTKEILYTLLTQKYKTLKTEASKNSPIAIAELVLQHLNPDIEIFIVEMGAYKKGEIAQMCQLVQPQIGIITAINAQHQDLFGSLENTVEAKYELLAGLTGKRIAIVNRDNPYVEKMGLKAIRDGCKVIEYSSRTVTVTQTLEGLQFDSFSVKLFGVHQVSNMLAAITCAKAVGMTKEEVKRACAEIRPLLHTMNPIPGVNRSTYIDDTFNNNPDAAIAAIDYLATQKGRKILVFQPMIELGAYAKESHQRVANRAAEVCDEIIITNDSFSDLFSAMVLSPQAAANHLKSIVHDGDTVLFKGKEAGRVLQLLV